MHAENDFGKFKGLIAGLAITFGRELTEPLIDAYWVSLRDLDLAILQRAAAKAMREMKFMPKPAELRELAGEGNGESRAIAAWGDVLKAIPLGPYKHIDFQDRLCNASIRVLGGWPTFLERFCDSESEKWARLDFVKTYQSLSSSGIDGDAAKPLAGLAEVQASGGKTHPARPIRIACSNPPPRIEQKRKQEPRLELKRP